MMNVNELEGAELDAAVAKAEGWYQARPWPEQGPYWCIRNERGHADMYLVDCIENQDRRGIWMPSREWAQAGPIIERERIAITCHAWGGSAYLPSGAEAWVANTLGDMPKAGPTPLIAAMRAFVASKKT